MLVQDALKDAMKLIRATEMDETPSASEMSTALRVANVMLGHWSSKKLLLRSPRTLTIPLVAGQNSYTIGLVGADVTSTKPISILSGFVRDSGNRDTPVEIIPNTQYNSAFDLKSTQAPVSYVTYNPGSEQQDNHIGTVYVYPSPDTTGALILQATQYISDLSRLTDTLDFEPAYYEPFIYNLAVRLYRHYHTDEVPVSIVSIAGNGLQGLRTINNEKILAKSDFGGNGRYNVYTDGY